MIQDKFSMQENTTMDSLNHHYVSLLEGKSYNISPFESNHSSLLSLKALAPNNNPKPQIQAINSNQ